MKKDLCELVVIVDESGSMGSQTNDVIGGFNQFLETHKGMPGTAKLTLVKFNTGYSIIHNGVDIKDVAPFNNQTYYPGGGTALLDAVGRAVDEVGKRLNSTPESKKPGKVIVVIMTDGEENSSHEYTTDQIKAKIKEQQEKWNWEFTFIGADVDAWDTAQSMGIFNAAVYDVKNTKKMYKSMSNYTASSRGFAGNMGSQGPQGTAGIAAMSMADSLTLSDEELDQKLDDLKNNTVITP